MNMTTTPQSVKSATALSPKKHASPWLIAFKHFISNRQAVISLSFILIVALVCILAPLLTSNDPVKINLRLINKPPSAEHWLGTDKGGRDILTRLLYGGQTTLLIAFSISFFVTTFGTFVGAVAGFYGGKIDSALMRFTDFVLIFPFLIFVIVLKTIFTESGVGILIFVISVLSWGGAARLVRGKILSEKENEYILSAISIGCSPFKVITKHLLPNVISTVIVQAILIIASMIAAETGLSYLGFGVPANVPSWGNMMSDAISPEVIKNQWWVWAPSGILITGTILAINFVGEGLKIAFNPKKT
ncbi:oligopeptide ABC transporter permease [Paenibacillus albiflavus]